MLIKPLFFTKSNSYYYILIRLAFWAFFYIVPLQCSEHKQKLDSLATRDPERIPVRHVYLFANKPTHEAGQSYSPGNSLPCSFSIKPEQVRPSLNPMSIDPSGENTTTNESSSPTLPTFIASPSSVSPEQTNPKKRPAQSDLEGIQKKLKTLATKTTKLQKDLDKAKDADKRITKEQDELGAQCQTLATDHDKVCSQLTITNQNVVELTRTYGVLAKEHDELKKGAEQVVGKMAIDVLKIIQSMQAKIDILEQQAAQLAPLQKTVADLAQGIKSFSPDFQLPPLFPALQTQSFGVEEDL
ncbi:MAG TPA: hypothetical protein VFF04_00635 [Candidatus Babeliales bacterium]|nr:hypothetical protein [Candidatus Babeliales bacterium]